MTALLIQFGPYILAAILAAFGAFKIRQSGANAEKAKQAKAEAKARAVADEVDSDIGALPSGVAREELRKWGRD